MIVGVTHLTMEADLKRGTAWAEALGFGVSFIDDVALPAGFERVDDTDAPLPLALLESGNGIRLEVVAHQRHSGYQGAYAGIFRCAPPPEATVVDRPEVARALRGVLRAPVCAATAEPAGQAWFESTAPDRGLAGILCTVRDVPAEVEFWTAFAGTTWHTAGPHAARGAVSSPLHQTRCALVLVRDEKAPTVHAMNDPGYPSIGVYSTSIDADCRRAVSAGARLHSPPIVTTVGGRSVRMALIHTPAGAPVELLCAHRSAAGRP